jgi:hypothetical protein
MLHRVAQAQLFKNQNLIQSNMNPAMGINMPD